MNFEQVKKILDDTGLLFITGAPGIGKSAFAKGFAEAYKHHYASITYLYYNGSLKTCISQMEDQEDTEEMSEEELFAKHYESLQKLSDSSLLIIDDYNQLPKEDGFFKELVKNKFQILVTTRCIIPNQSTIEISPMKREQIPEFFSRYSKTADEKTMLRFGELSGCNTLVLKMTACSLNTSRRTPDELLQTLEKCSKEESAEDILIHQLRTVFTFADLTEDQIAVLRNLSLLPACGSYKNLFGNWIGAEDLSVIQELISLGWILENTEEGTIAFAPLVQKALLLETCPTITNCSTMIHSLHRICLAPGLQKQRPLNTIRALISVIEHITMDDPQSYLLFLQDAFPYLDKYMVTSYLPRLIDRISEIMEQHHLDSPCDRALLLDYKAELFMQRKDFDNALKKCLKSIEILEKLHTPEADRRTVNLLANTYNNLSNLYLHMQKGEEAIGALRTAFNIRMEYYKLGLVETKAMLQQIMNLLSMLILSQEQEQADEVLRIYENFVLTNIGEQSVDYGVCLLAQGIFTLSAGNPRFAEMQLLQAEDILIRTAGEENEFLQTVYRYLAVLYQRWNRPQLAEEYLKKLN